nr:hypothetical protein [Entomoneis sp.]
MLIYLILYATSFYISSRLTETPISIKAFINNFTDHYPANSKREQLFYILKNLKSLFLNPNHLNALKFLAIYNFAVVQCEKINLLISQAIGSGHYHSTILQYLKSNPHLLTIAVHPETLKHLDSFANLHQNDVPLIVNKINRAVLSSNDETVIITQIPKLISLLFIMNKLNYTDYIKALLNFLQGKGLSDKIKLLLRELIKDHRIIFKFSFLDFF